MLASCFQSGEFFLNIPCLIHFYVGSFLLHIFHADFVSCGEFLLVLHIPCCLHFYAGSFSSLAGFIFMRGVSLTHPVLASFWTGELLLRIPCWIPFFVFCFVCFCFTCPSFSYTPRAGSLSYRCRGVLIYVQGIWHAVLASFLSFFFSFSFFCKFGEFLLHIPCRLHFYLASLSYTIMNTENV